MKQTAFLRRFSTQERV